MRYVVIPPPAVVTDIRKPDGTHPTLTMRDFVRSLVNAQRVMESDQTIGWFMEIADAFELCEPGQVVALPDELHEFLSGVARSFNYSPEVKLAILPLAKAITGAARERVESISQAGKRGAA